MAVINKSASIKLRVIILLVFGFSSCFMFLSAQSLKTDTVRTKSGKNVEITFIKHSSLYITYDKKVIMIDPVSRYADFKSFPKADFILITHEHGDHLDNNAIEQLSKKETLIVANEASIKKTGKGKSVKNGETIKLSDKISVNAVPAYNTTPDNMKFHPQGRDNGYILSIDGFNIYIAGDTEFYPEMKNFKNIHIAFLPINLPYTMSVDQAIKAAKTISPKIFYPYHYGNTDLKPLIKGLENSGIDVRIRNME
jgi:L-ascorbate metabolism protein UlaG (beta-lactamase superfamily)